MMAVNKALNVLIYVFFFNSVLCKICNFNIKVEQTLHNEGFHRNLSYYIDFASDDDEENWLYENCVVGLEQTLPPGVFASHDEIKDHGCKGLIHTIFKAPVNIEQPAKDASPITIQLFSKVERSRTHIFIPVHARYHHASRGGGTVRNIIGPPKLNLMCPDKKLNVCDFPSDAPVNNFCAKGVSRELCPWKEIPAIMVTDTLFWDVPIGNTDHYYLVAWGTTVVIVVGSLYLLKTIHGYKIETERRLRKKQKL
ncbi:unnamed protein product [Euphydryas editha]|uniref:Phosphatidylinositol-glycan biosynthesis class X protein n=1 Tax=Euphydryas editha TaxID=104508 RepID=A0AAU9U9M0_EUPED|nr:unnamed protein product [Euphydryas editha]